MATSVLSRPCEAGDRRAAAPAGGPAAPRPVRLRPLEVERRVRPGSLESGLDVPGRRPVRAPRPRARRRPTTRPRVRGGDPDRLVLQRPRAASGALRLTRRGRLLVVLLLVAVLSTAFALGRVGAQGSTTTSAPAQVGERTVQPGDTLWSVARQLAPGQDPRPVVEQLRRLNHLDGDTLHAGQLLLLPQPR